ncbi:MAG: superoxide dismutase [Cu-Zn] SodC, partial [Rubrivivax sp.]
MHQKLSIAALGVALAAGAAGPAAAAELTLPLAIAGSAGPGASVGQVRIVETAYGLVFYPALSGLPPGVHGFHVHEKPSCDPGSRDGTVVAALGAGGHYDPQNTQRHGEPWGDGHLGDLPPLTVGADGRATQPVLAPRLKTIAEISKRSLMVHAGGDNHADQPAALGGGGARIACGVMGG